MEKILTQNMPMEKIDTDLKKYKIKVSPKDNGYQARTTLDLGGVVKQNPRLECFSTQSAKMAINRLVEKMQITLSSCTSKRIKLVQIEEPDTIYYVLQDTSEKPSIKINNFIPVKQELQKTPSSLTIEKPSTLENSTFKQKQFSNYEHCTKNKYLANPNITYTVTDVGYIWFNYLLERTEKNPEDENYLGKKTAESYIYILKRYIIPYLKKVTDISLLEDENLINLLETINGKTQKKDTLTVLKIFFSFAKTNKYIKYNIANEIKLPRKKKTLDEIPFIEEKEREKWITCLLEENSDISLLYLSMLLTSARPEEACGFKWTAFDFESNDVYICNAFKDFPVYNEFMEIINHIRKDDILKTPESYRHIYLDEILKKALLKHKEKQQNLFKRFHKKWTENEYLFLNQNFAPFVSDTLSRNMPRFLKRNSKYNLGHMTVYGLRHSFATHCKELGMDAEVLAKLMGHTDYVTTQKYYIHVSKQRKVDALKRIQEKERNGFKALKIEDINELEEYNKQTFEDFNNYGIEIKDGTKIKSTLFSALA